MQWRKMARKQNYLEGASFVLLEEFGEVSSGDVALGAGELVPARDHVKHWGEAARDHVKHWE
jgi:hypothetical protein